VAGREFVVNVGAGHDGCVSWTLSVIECAKLAQDTPTVHTSVSEKRISSVSVGPPGVDATTGAVAADEMLSAPTVHNNRMPIRATRNLKPRAISPGTHLKS
jgi:hypothetical protein